MGRGLPRGDYQQARIIRGRLELAATPGRSDSPTRHLRSVSGTVASGVRDNWEWVALEEGVCQVGAPYPSRGTRTIAAAVGLCLS